LATGRELFVLEGHAKELTFLAFLPDSKTLVSADEDSTLKVWNAATGKEIRTIKNEGPQLEGIPFMTALPDGKHVVAWLARSSVGTFNVLDGKETAELDLGDRTNIKCLSISRDGAIAAVGHTDGVVRLWDISGKKRSGADLKAHEKELADLALTPDKKELVTSDISGEVKVWDLAQRKARHTIAAHKQKIMALAISADGARFATVGADNIVKLWDRATGKELRQWDLHMPVLTAGSEGDRRSFVNTLAFTPDGKHVATGNTDTTMYLLDCP